jgi:hypothetical protein
MPVTPAEREEEPDVALLSLFVRQHARADCGPPVTDVVAGEHTFGITAVHRLKSLEPQGPGAQLKELVDGSMAVQVLFHSEMMRVLSHRG